MAKSNFVHLHVHTEYSFLESIIKIDELIEQAKKLRFKALAITNTGNMIGAIRFSEKARAAGIKPIIGCEVGFIPALTGKEKESSNAEKISQPLILLVKNNRGYKNLCKILSQSLSRESIAGTTVTLPILGKHNEGLIAIMPTVGFYGHDYRISYHPSEVRDYARLLSGIFSDGCFYLGVHPGKPKVQSEAVVFVKELQEDIGVPVVPTYDCRYLKAKDTESFAALMAYKHGKKLEDIDISRIEATASFLKSTEEVKNDLKGWDNAIANTFLIANKCSFDFEEIVEVHWPIHPSSKQKLRELAMKELSRKLDSLDIKRILSKEDSKKYHARLDYEINIINQIGASDYFLTVADYVNYARCNDMPVGPGRGSCSASLVAYCIGITEVDPIKYDLPFERFINAERYVLLDIDIDFCARRRDEVVRYIVNKYGHDKVASPSTYSHFSSVAALVRAGEVLGISSEKIEEIKTAILPDGRQYGFELKDTPGRWLESESKLFKIASALDGLCNKPVGIHSCGVIISDSPIADYIPVFSGDDDGLPITQYDYGDVERLGAFKFDLLGLKELTVIGEALRLIKEECGKDILLDEISLYDDETLQFFGEANTENIFQFRSSGIREFLKRLRPLRFSDLVALMSMYRPGPLACGMVDDFIERKNGNVPVNYDLPQIESALKETYGVIVYQEQIMKLARMIAGFTFSKADILRREMGKKKADEMKEERGHIFIYHIRFDILHNVPTSTSQLPP